MKGEELLEVVDSLDLYRGSYEITETKPKSLGVREIRLLAIT